MKILLLWVTALSTMLYAMSIDSLNLLAFCGWGVINFILIMICYYFLTYKEVKKYSGCDFIDKLLKMEEKDYE